MAKPDIKWKIGKSKPWTFTVTDEDGAAVNLSAATLTFIVRKTAGSSKILLQKDNADFVRTQEAVGIVSVQVSATDLNYVGDFQGELKIYASAANIDKSETFLIRVDHALT